MKSVIASAIILITLFSCSKNKTAESEESKIKVENGILVFDNHETFSSTLKTLNSLNDIEKNKWEKEKGFVSFRTKLNEMNEKIHSVATKEELDRIVAKGKDIFIVENEEVIPFADNFFSSIVNQEGIVRINNDYYRFFKDFETVVLNGTLEQVKTASERRVENIDAGIYNRKIKSQLNSVNANRYTCTSGVMSECRSEKNNNRRGYHKLEFNYYFTIVRDPITLLPTHYQEDASVTLHFSGTKKVLGIWFGYSTGYTCSQLNYSDNDGVNISLTNLGSNGDFKDWYYNLNFRRFITPYGGPTPNNSCSPDITLFNCSAATGGTIPNYCTFTY